jgi:hypothetical protein
MVSTTTVGHQKFMTELMTQLNTDKHVSPEQVERWIDHEVEHVDEHGTVFGWKSVLPPDCERLASAVACAAKLTAYDQPIEFCRIDDMSSVTDHFSKPEVNGSRLVHRVRTQVVFEIVDES